MIYHLRHISVLYKIYPPFKKKQWKQEYIFNKTRRCRDVKTSEKVCLCVCVCAVV